MRSVGVPQQPDQVILRAEGDDDVLDRVVQAQRLQGAHLGPDHLGVAGHGELQVKVLSAAERPQRHLAVPARGVVTIYAIASRAVLVIIGDEGLDITRLHRESQTTLDTIRKLIADDAPPPKTP